MSAWGKFFAQIVVPTCGWTIRFEDSASWYTATLPAGTYATILHLLDELMDAMTTESGGNYYSSLSAAGITTIDGDDFTDIDWSNTSDDLEDCLGYDGTETVGTALVGTNPHLYGWYPGMISRGSTLGEGLSYDDEWQPEDMIARAYAGTGAARLISPARMKYTRHLRYGTIHRDEIWHRTRGVKCMMDRWATGSLYWYMDRDDGIRTAGVPAWVTGYFGGQCDPGYEWYNNDDSGEYYIVTLNEMPRLTVNASHPDWWSVDLSLNAEPR